ncbi:MAG: iron transporter [Planctomycetaceae bacterium]
MLKRWSGPLVTTLIIGGVALIVLLNLNWTHPAPSEGSGPSPAPAQRPAAAPRPGNVKFREYPIGDEVIQDHMRIAAVWLPPIEMEGMAGPSSSDVIHLEADIRATEGNRNGFAKDEFVPYLKIRYAILPAGGGEPVHRGELMPMVARDGVHYGASVAMPAPGSYRLVYDIEPPSAGGLGRHSDPVTGVAPWWEPFRVEFDWDYPGPPAG